MSAKPLVSICIPVYNREELLLECVESARNQTWENIEIVISDNASTDGTTDAALAMAAEDRRIKVLTATENVVGLNYHRVISGSTGEFIKLLNSDDLLYPEAVERLVEAFEPGITLAFGRAEYITASGEPTKSRLYETWLNLLGNRRLDGKEFGQWMLDMVCNLIGEPTFTMFRREHIDPLTPTGYAGRSWRYLNDWSTWLHLLEQGDAAYVDEALVAIRRHAGSGQHKTGNDLVLAYDIEGITHAASQRSWKTSSPRTRPQITALRGFTHRPYIVEGAPGMTDQLEGVRLITERIMGSSEPDAERRGVEFILGPIPLDDERELEALLSAWWQAFPDRSDVELLLPAHDEAQERSHLRHVNRVRDERGFATTPVRVVRTDANWAADRPVTMVRAGISASELAGLVRPERAAAPPWAPMHTAPWVEIELR